MKTEKIMTENIAPQMQLSFRKFSLRILLIWMFIVFAYWLVVHQLSSELLQNNTVASTLPAFLKSIDKTKLHLYFLITEIIFSTSLLICFFLQQSRIIFLLHIISAIAMALCMYTVNAFMFVPFIGYIVICFAFLYRDEKKFSEAFDFLQAMVVCIIFLYAFDYFFKWYHYMQTSYLQAVLLNSNKNVSDFNARNTVAKNVMPWYYIIYLFFIIRIFTSKWNCSLFYFACIIIFLEYFFNVFFDPMMFFMLIPFLNWKKLFSRFNKKFEVQ